MELKKSPKADLEKRRGLFLEIGIICALLLCIGMFSIGQAKINFNTDVAPMPVIEDAEIIEITREPEQIETQDPRVAVNVQSDLLNIVNNEQQIETEMIFDDFDENTEVSFDASAGGGGGGYSSDAESVPFALIENPPVFPNGDFMLWVQNNVKYPLTLERSGMSGRVIYNITIDTNGSISDIQVIASPHQLFTDAVMSVIKSAPKWTPGKQRGRPVKVIYQAMADFILQ